MKHKSIFIYHSRASNPSGRGGFTSSAAASKTAWRPPKPLRKLRLSYHRWRRQLPSRCLRLPLSGGFLFPKIGVSRRPITRSLCSYAPLERNFLFDEHATFRTTDAKMRAHSHGFCRYVSTAGRNAHAAVYLALRDRFIDGTFPEK